MGSPAAPPQPEGLGASQRPASSAHASKGGVDNGSGHVVQAGRAGVPPELEGECKGGGGPRGLRGELKRREGPGVLCPPCVFMVWVPGVYKLQVRINRQPGRQAGFLPGVHSLWSVLECTALEGRHMCPACRWSVWAHVRCGGCSCSAAVRGVPVGGHACMCALCLLFPWMPARS